MLFVFSGIGFSQEGLTDFEPSESTEVRETCKPDFHIVFIDEDDLNNFKNLRLYLKKSKISLIDLKLQLKFITLRIMRKWSQIFNTHNELRM